MADRRSALLRIFGPDIMLDDQTAPEREDGLDLVVHIGGHKTGSTAIQETALWHSAELAANGIFYPAQRPYFTHAQHSHLADLIKNGRLKQVSRFLAAAATEARAQGATTLFLSGEELWTLSQRSVSRFHEIVRQVVRSVRIICVTRNERDRIMSNFKHFLRHDPSRSILQFVRDNRRILRPAQDIWTREFGDSVSVLRYEDLSDRLVPNFFKCVFGCDLEHNPKSNMSLDMLTLAVNNHFIKDWKDEDTERVLWEFSRKYNTSPQMPIETITINDILKISKKHSISSARAMDPIPGYDPVETCDRMIFLFTALRGVLQSKQKPKGKS